MTWQVWFQSTFNFAASISQLRRAKIAGDISQSNPGIYYFNFVDSKDIQYEITTKSKMSISYPGKFDDYKKYLLRVKPFLVKADSSTARKFEIYKKMKDGKIFENEKIRAKANHSLVSDYVDKINTLDNVKVLHSRLIQLRELSAYKRIGHHPNVLKCLEDSLGNSMITQNPETFRLVIETLENILGYEQQIKEEDSEAILKIRKEITTKLILLLKTKPDYL